MPMKMPKTAPEPLELFRKLVEGDARLAVKKVFGHPTAFVNGNMSFGVFGSDLFFRLSDADQKLAVQIPGTRPFEPMPGRPMRGYLVLPSPVLKKVPEARRWVERSVRHALSLPPKGTKARPPGPRS